VTHTLFTCQGPHAAPAAQRSILPLDLEAVKQKRSAIRTGKLYPETTSLSTPSFRTAEGRFPGLLPCHALSEAGGPRASKAGTDAATYESCGAPTVRETAIASRSSSSKERVSPRTVGSIAAARMTSATPSVGSRSRSAPRIIFRLLP